MTHKKYHICPVSEVDGDLLMGCRCPKCSELYVMGYYFVKDEREHVYVSNTTSICIQCALGNLKTPLLFYTADEARDFLEEHIYAGMQSMDAEYLDLYYWSARDYAQGQNVARLCM